MTEIEMREAVFSDLYAVSQGIESRMPQIVNRFRDVNFRYEPEIENELVEEIYNIALLCHLKWYDGSYYVFDGKIYVIVSMDAVESAFSLWMMRIGLHLPQKRKRDIFRYEFLPSMKITNKMNPRLDIVAFSNGVLDLSDNTFHDFSPDYHCLYYHPYKYDVKATCPKWKAFLKEVLPDKNSRMILQMFLGLGLIERGTVYNQCEGGKEHPKIELCLILIGEGANGKSVVYQTAMGLFGKNRISGVDYDELTASGDEGMRARRMLRDAIFNWSSDSDARSFGKKRTGVFKRIVSGEPVTDRAIGGNVSQIYDLPYLVFNLNELPYPDETSLGFIRRLQFVSFDVTIPEARQNKTLAQELAKEYSGIFNWVMRGTREIRRRKFQFPDAEGSRRQVLLAQLRGNPIVAWVNSYHVRSQAKVKGEAYIWMPTADVIESIFSFCEDNDADMPSKQLIGHTLSKMGFGKKRDREGYLYKMYGVMEGDLIRSFVIRNETFLTSEERERVIGDEEDTFIDETD